MSKRNKLLLPIMIIILMAVLTACGGPISKPSVTDLLPDKQTRRTENLNISEDRVDSSEDYENNGYDNDSENSDNNKESAQEVPKGELGLTSEEYVPLVNDKLGSNIVYKANVSLSSSKYVEDKNKIINLLNSKDIAIQYQEESTRDSYDEVRKEETKLRVINIVARPEKEKFDSVLQEVQGIGTLEHLSRGSEDISREVQDLDIRLKTVNSRIERLESHIKSTQSIEEVLKLESILEQEIVNRDQILSAKETVKDKINLTTIEITLEERIPDYTKEEQLEFERIEKEKRLEEERLEKEAERIQIEQDKFGYRFKQEFKNMIFNTKTAIEDFILFIVGNFTALILLVVIGILVFKNQKKKRLERKNNPIPKYPLNKNKKNIDEIYKAANSKTETIFKDEPSKEMSDKEKDKK